jgi:hypothetical protein
MRSLFVLRQFSTISIPKKHFEVFFILIQTILFVADIKHDGVLLQVNLFGIMINL